jgi:hypothetical protein
MAGLGIRLYTDEMISPALARALRRAGYQAESCGEAGLSGQSIADAEQLDYATEHDRAILTFNVRDFIKLDQGYEAVDRRHAGIVLAPQIDDLGALLRYVQRHLDTIAPARQQNTLLWLDTSDAY